MTDTEETKPRKPRTSQIEKAILSARRKLEVALKQHETRTAKSAEMLAAKQEDILAPFSEEVRAQILHSDDDVWIETSGTGG